MLEGAMDASPWATWDPATDVGPVIDAEAEAGIWQLHRGAGCAEIAGRARRGRFVPPT